MNDIPILTSTFTDLLNKNIPDLVECYNRNMVVVVVSQVTAEK
jgi:hypothetical protein